MRVSARKAFVASAWLGVSLAVAASGQSFDVTGSWAIQMTASPPRGGSVAVGCTFQGTANAIQSGSQVSGDIAVDLTAGSGCPSAMSATMTGDVTGNQLTMGVAMGGGTLGEATFTGTITPGTAGTRRAAGELARGARAAGPATPTTPQTAPVRSAIELARPAAGPVRPAAGPATVSGTFAVTSGPFTGTGGTWSATQLQPIAAVPALGAQGLAALALLVLVAALWFLGRRSALRRL